MRLLLGIDTATCNDDARIVAQSALRVDAATIERVLASEAQMRDRAITQDLRYSQMAAAAVRFSEAEMAVGNSSDSASGDE